MQGYVNDVAATIGAFDEDGWFNTGDVGEGQMWSPFPFPHRISCHTLII